MYRKQVVSGHGFGRLFSSVISKVSKKAIPRILKSSARKITKSKNIKRLLNIGKRVLKKNPKLRKAIKANTTSIIAASVPSKKRKQKTRKSNKKKVPQIATSIVPSMVKSSRFPPQKKKKKKSKKSNSKKRIFDTIKPISSTVNPIILGKKKTNLKRNFKGWRRLATPTSGSGIILR